VAHNKNVHELSKESMDSLADVAMGDGLKSVRAFLAYQGNDQRYAQKAKAGIGLIGAYSRFYSSQTNRMAIEMQTERENERGMVTTGRAAKSLTAGRTQ
jgi:hypothetical protein